MALITSKSLQRHIHTTSNFTIQHMVSFSLVSILSPVIPSSEEGRAALKVVEKICAVLTVVLETETASKMPRIEQIYEEIIEDVSEPQIYAIESSVAYSRMDDENKKKILISFRKLLEAIAEKEAILSNSHLLTDGSTTLSDCDAKITEIQKRINARLAKASLSPLVESAPVSKAVSTLMSDHVDDLVEKTLLDRIDKAAKAGYILQK